MSNRATSSFSRSPPARCQYYPCASSVVTIKTICQTLPDVLLRAQWPLVENHSSKLKLVHVALHALSYIMTTAEKIGGLKIGV